MVTRNIPEGAELREFPAARMIAYCYEGKFGPAFVVYKGRQTKAFAHFYYPTSAQRDTALLCIVEREAAAVQVSAKNAAARVHGLTVGDVLYESYGYEQTNVNFYQVVRVPSAISVVVIAIAKDTIEHKDLAMTGTVTPKIDCFAAGGKEHMRRAVDAGIVNGFSGSGCLKKWDGKPKRVSFYA